MLWAKLRRPIVPALLVAVTLLVAGAWAQDAMPELLASPWAAVTIAIAGVGLPLGAAALGTIGAHGRVGLAFGALVPSVFVLAGPALARTVDPFGSHTLWAGVYESVRDAMPLAAGLLVASYLAAIAVRARARPGVRVALALVPWLAGASLARDLSPMPFDIHRVLSAEHAAYLIHLFAWRLGGALATISLLAMVAFDVGRGRRGLALLTLGWVLSRAVVDAAGIVAGGEILTTTRSASATSLDLGVIERAEVLASVTEAVACTVVCVGVGAWLLQQAAGRRGVAGVAASSIIVIATGSRAGEPSIDRAWSIEEVGPWLAGIGDLDVPVVEGRTVTEGTRPIFAVSRSGDLRGLQREIIETHEMALVLDRRLTLGDVFDALARLPAVDRVRVLGHGSALSAVSFDARQRWSFVGRGALSVRSTTVELWHDRPEACTETGDALLDCPERLRWALISANADRTASFFALLDRARAHGPERVGIVLPADARPAERRGEVEWLDVAPRFEWPPDRTGIRVVGAVGALALCVFGWLAALVDRVLGIRRRSGLVARGSAPLDRIEPAWLDASDATHELVASPSEAYRVGAVAETVGATTRGRHAAALVARTARALAVELRSIAIALVPAILVAIALGAAVAAR